MNNLDPQYQSMLQDILDKGTNKKDRTGTGTVSVFSRQISHNMNDGFPLLTTKKMAWKTLVTELLWFLRGDTNIKYLVDRSCNIWNGDAYKNYCKIAGSYSEPDMTVHIDDPNQHRTRLMTQAEFIEKIKTDDTFAKEWGDLGPIYGKQWRDWNFIGTNGDQIRQLLHDLKHNPDSRRLMVNAWNVESLEEMVLPPCHYGFQVYTHEIDLKDRLLIFATELEKDISFLDDFDHERLDAHGVPSRYISLAWNQRSVDTFLGLPFNIASYGLLLNILARMVNMVPYQLSGHLGDVHLYQDHLAQAKTQIKREPLPLCELEISDEALWILKSDKYTVVQKFKQLQSDMFGLKDYVSHDRISAPLSN